MAQPNPAPGNPQARLAPRTPLQRSAPRPQSGAPQPPRPGKEAIPTTKDCLTRLAKLPGLIAMKILTTQQANSIRAAYQTILDEHARAQESPQGQLADESVLAILRQQPELLSAIAPLLTYEQVAMVMQGEEDEDEQEPQA